LAENETPELARGPEPGLDDQEIVLAELLSRVLDRGVVVSGEVTISVAGIDLIYLGLRLQLASTETLLRRARARGEITSHAGPGDEKPAR
jgi:hypothetical protein